MVHNLDEGLEESFQFVMGGYTCTMRYPTTEEMESLDKETDVGKVTDIVYSFITMPEGAPTFRELMDKSSVLVGKRFLKMIKEEFSVDL